MSVSSCTTRERGFTLIELLVVIAIIAVLIALLLPYIEQDNIFKAYKTPITGVSMTDGFNNHTSTHPQIVAARQTQISIFFCPARRNTLSFSPITTGSSVTGFAGDYAACTGDTSTVPTTGVFRLVNSNHMNTYPRFRDIIDGTSNTIMIGEKHIQLTGLNDPITDGMILSASEAQTYHRRAGASWSLAANETAVVNFQFGSWHPGLGQFVFADGTVRGLRTSLPGSTLGLLANISDGQPIPDLD